MIIPKRIKSAFLSVAKTIYTTENLAGTMTKYHHPIEALKRFYPTLEAIKESKLQVGLDFGCGYGMTTILGKLMGLQIIGLDLDYQQNPVTLTKFECPYKKIQQAVRDLGYRIVNRNTTEYPWQEFKDDQFDFVISYWSIGMSMNLVPGNTQKYSEGLNQRYRELLRVTKPSGSWYTYPYKYLSQIDTFLGNAEVNSKGVKSLPWITTVPI